MEIDLKNKKYKCANGNIICSLVKVNPKPADGYIYLGLVFDGEDYLTCRWAEEGKEIDSSDYNLVEVNPWKDVPVDTKCYVWNNTSSEKSKRHFAYVDTNGKPRFFDHGLTSWTADPEEDIAWNTSPWNYAEIAKDV